MITPGCPVKFCPDRHRYTLDGRELFSVSSWIKRCTPPFDPDGQIIARCAEREGITVSELRQRWDRKRDDSTDRGKAIHSALQAYVENAFIWPDHARHVEQLKRWPFKGRLFCETILWSEEHLLAGTADLIEMVDEKTVRLYDFKTNERLEKENRWNRFLLPPVSHVPNIDWAKYELQLSFYALMLRRFGWTVERMTIFHIDHQGVWTSHRARDLETECLEILNRR